MLDILQINENISNYCLLSTFILTSGSNTQQYDTIELGYLGTCRDAYLQNQGSDTSIEQCIFGGLLFVLIDECNQYVEYGSKLVAVLGGRVLFLRKIVEVGFYFVFEVGGEGDGMPLPIYIDNVSETYNMAIQLYFTIISFIIEKIE